MRWEYGNMGAIHCSKTLREAQLLLKSPHNVHSIISLWYLDILVEETLRDCSTKLMDNVTCSWHSNTEEMGDCSVYSTLVPSLHKATASLFSTVMVCRSVLSCCNLMWSSSHKCRKVLLLTRKFLFHSRSSHAEITSVNAWLLLHVQTDRHCAELINNRSADWALANAPISASWSSQKAAICLLLAKICLLLLLKRILCRCLSHTMDNSPKQRKTLSSP